MQRAALHPRAGILEMDPEWLISSLPLSRRYFAAVLRRCGYASWLGAASLALRAEMPERAFALPAPCLA